MRQSARLQYGDAIRHGTPASEAAAAETPRIRRQLELNAASSSMWKSR
ncbi:hypothetical protein [Klebsiella pneumoniae]